MTTLDPAEPAQAPSTATCPRCGAERIAGATFCEACAFEFTDLGGGPSPAPPPANAPGPEPGRPDEGAAAPVTALPGEESPLDVGWTGPVAADERPPAGGIPEVAIDESQVCLQCDEGHYLDGYCDHCGSKQPDPRDHFAEAPAPWVAGVCDIGRRHRRNEDAMALTADPSPLSFAALVICDGVSNSTDSHIASLGASRAARDVLRKPLARGVGTRAAVVGAAQQRLGDAVEAAQRAVVETTNAAGEAAVANPPSCTFVAAVVVDGTVVAGNVGDSRAYWLPDADTAPARQLGEDDSFAAAQMSAGMPRQEAETSAGAHAITRWLGVDSPEDLTPHTDDLDLTEDGWLLVCSDGLWNYWSDADDLRRVVHEAVARLGPAGRHPPTLAQALTDGANEAGGADNITVALVRVGDVAPAPAPAEPPPASRTLDEAPAPADPPPVAPTHTDESPDTKDNP